jgi:hypothetical protein
MTKATPPPRANLTHPQLREMVSQQFERDAVFWNDDRHDLTRPQQRERSMRRVPPAHIVR